MFKIPVNHLTLGFRLADENSGRCLCELRHSAAEFQEPVVSFGFVYKAAYVRLQGFYRQVDDH